MKFYQFSKTEDRREEKIRKSRKGGGREEMKEEGKERGSLLLLPSSLGRSCTSCNHFPGLRVLQWFAAFLLYFAVQLGIGSSMPRGPPVSATSTEVSTHQDQDFGLIFLLTASIFIDAGGGLSQSFGSSCGSLMKISNSFGSMVHFDDGEGESEEYGQIQAIS